MTATTADTEEKILDLAEALIRTNGYNGFSFRDIASGVGVKSSSVHYYFPTKADLGAKVARRYTDRFLVTLGDPDTPAVSADELVGKLHAEFATALGKDGQMCLCGVLAAESAGLPDAVVEEAKSFFDKTGDWLKRGLKKTAWGSAATEEDLHKQSLSVLAQLEGAMLIARVQGKPAWFNDLKPKISGSIA
ncbi:TetR/AcrR family transcriptional regulator [uncultured Roseibium sp.]|uniref:TetR/AcrR family transcriptional regulator n=1 Tax=uncultured Roseibium sp. TaxID=1936171 RepID=UPI0026264910|nr:TetR/AcrR family transcriptional regulator [uncultured Roseibium sp.]